MAGRRDAYAGAACGPREQVIRGWAPGYFAGPVLAEVREEVVVQFSEFDPRVLASLARSFAETDLRDVLPTIDVPTLLLYGAGDVRLPLYVAEALHSAIPGSTLIILPGVGHISNVEAPDRFNAEVRGFLGAVRKGAQD